MLSPISGAPLLNPAQDLRQVQAPAPQQTEEASQLPAELPTDPPPSTIVDISDEGKRLLAARAVTESPVAVAALSDNPQVDAAAESVYMAQQAQQMLDIYSDISSNQCFFCYFACQIRVFGTQVYQHGVVVCTTGNDCKATVNQSLCQYGCILFYLCLIFFVFRL